MPIKRYKYKPGEVIVIEAEPEKIKPTPPPEDRGPIDPYFGSDFPGRRLDMRKWLNVYDLHRTAEGVDLPFSAFYTLSLDEPSPPLYDSLVGMLFGGDGWINAYAAGPTEAAAVAAWNSYVLPGSASELAATRRKITSELEAYGITFDGLGDYEITDKGIEIPENITQYKGGTSNANAIKWNMLRNPNFEAWLDRTLTTSSQLTTKITMVPNYFSASAFITVDKSIDVFLAPAVFWSRGYSRDASWVEPPFPHTPQTWFYNMGSQRTINRSDSLGDASFAEFWSYVEQPPLMSSAPAPVKDYYMNYFQRDSRSAYTLDTGHPPTPLPGGPSHWYSVFSTAGGQVERMPTHHNDLGTIGMSTYAGQLKAIVRKHLAPGEYEYYYVWADEYWNGSGIMPWIVGGTIAHQMDF